MLRLTVWALGLTLTAGSAGAASLTDAFSSFYVFGDSLSDIGNRDPSSAPPIYYINPDNGGVQFSDGPVWADLLDDAYGSGAPDPVTGAVTSRNYAYGGAQAVSDGGWPDMTEQVLSFVGDVTSGAPDAPVLGDKPLVSLFFGGNDVLQVLTDFVTDIQAALDAPLLEQPFRIAAAYSSADTSLRRTVRAIANMAGAIAATNEVDDVLVFNLPDIGKSPALSGQPVIAGILTSLSANFNDLLASELALIGGPGDTIYQFDTFGLVNEVFADPLSFGLTNVSETCVTSITSICANPEDYLFYDPIHPGSTLHAILAGRVLDLTVSSAPLSASATLSAQVPLPAGAPLLLAAVGLLALLRRRRT